jgi:hypothetical protein
MFGGGGAIAAGGGQAALSPSGLAVMCALPYTHGANGADCNGKHTIQYQVVGASGAAKVTAELMGLGTNGQLIKSFLVKNGDAAHLASRLPPGDWKFANNGHEYQVFAPVPLLHVTVEDQGQKAEAYCSNIPYLDVVQPSGGTVTDQTAGGSNVLAAVPLTNPRALHVYVDGDDLLADVPNYLGCTTVSPCSGTATINGQSLEYSNLVVDIASSIGSLASNTVRLSLDGLSCGGHIVKVTSARQLGLKSQIARSCNIDDLTATGVSSVFAISITDPLPGQVTPIIPTPVAGEVCSGTPIVDVNVNGKTLSLAGQTHVAGNGVSSGDVYRVKIDTTLDRTDLVRDALDTHDAPLGTFDAGTNRLAVSAREKGGARTYQRVLFATGAVAPIGVDVNATVFRSSAMQAAVNRQLKQMVETNVQKAMAATSTELENAYVVGLSAEGTQTLFNRLCTTPVPSGEFAGMTPGQIFKKKVTEAINSIGQPHISPDVPCASDPEVTLSISDVVVSDQLACNVDFHNGFFRVKVGLPSIHVNVHAYGTGGDWGDTVCVEGVKVEGDAFADVTGINLTYDVTEDNLLHNTFSAANFNAGATVASNGSVGVDFCGLSTVCNVIVTIFTFGAVDINPHIDFSLVQDFSTQINANQPDPVKLNEIKVDENVIANFDQKVSGAVSEVHITPDGISAGLKGTFATTLVDADVAETPGITLTPAAVPTMATMRAQGAKDALIGLSDDTINMMFASLTAAGKLKAGDAQGCFDTGVTVGSLLPTDCDSLALDSPPGAASAAARGYCHAIRGDSCGALAFGTDSFLTSTEQGICFGASGSVCTNIANGDLVKWGACSITPNFNLRAAQPLLFCAKGDVPPRMLFPSNGTAGGLVPTALRLNDLSVALVIDRTLNHTVDGPLNDAPGCFTGGATAVDCNVFSACLDLNLNFGMQFLTCSDGKPGFKSTFESLQVLNRQIGVVCSGGTSPTSDGSVLSSASQDTITIPIATNAGQLSPDICGAGLDLGGFVSCTTPQILSFNADTAPHDLQDYLGITCKIE